MRNIRLLTRLLSVTVMVLVVDAAPASAKKDKPNVVLMLADNLGYGDVSAYNGGTRGGMRTPRIDQLAAEGMRFTSVPRGAGLHPEPRGLDDRPILHPPGSLAHHRSRDGE